MLSLDLAVKDFLPEKREALILELTPDTASRLICPRDPPKMLVTVTTGLTLLIGDKRFKKTGTLNLLSENFMLPWRRKKADLTLVGNRLETT